jgi:hypothetical protein
VDAIVSRSCQVVVSMAPGGSDDCVRPTSSRQSHVSVLFVDHVNSTS